MSDGLPGVYFTFSPRLRIVSVLSFFIFPDFSRTRIVQAFSTPTGSHQISGTFFPVIAPFENVRSRCTCELMLTLNGPVELFLCSIQNYLRKHVMGCGRAVILPRCNESERNGGSTASCKMCGGIWCLRGNTDKHHRGSFTCAWPERREIRCAIPWLCSCFCVPFVSLHKVAPQTDEKIMV